jgi:hypothetical protein
VWLLNCPTLVPQIQLNSNPGPLAQQCESLNHDGSGIYFFACSRQRRGIVIQSYQYHISINHLIEPSLP